MSLITGLDQLNHEIPLSQAVEMTSRFQKEREHILKPEFQGRDILPIAETFHRAAFDKLLGQVGCVAIRAYPGMDTEKKVKLIFVGVNDANEDILPSESSVTQAADALSEGESLSTGADEDPVVVEEGQRCPPLCPQSTPLIQPLP